MRMKPTVARMLKPATATRATANIAVGCFATGPPPSFPVLLSDDEAAAEWTLSVVPEPPCTPYL